MKKILSNEYDNILFFIGEDRKEAFGWEGRNKTFGPNNTPYLYTYVNKNIPGNIKYSLDPNTVSYELDSAKQSKNKKAARKNASIKYKSQMPTLEKNTVYNIIIPRTKKEIQDDQKIAKNKKLFNLYQNMIKNAKKTAIKAPEFPSATMLRNLVINMDYQKYASIIKPNISNGWTSKKPNDAEWKKFQKVMITGLSDHELLNALANIKRGMGIRNTIDTFLVPHLLVPLLLLLKIVEEKPKKKKGGRRKKRTRKKRGGVGYDDEGYYVKYNTPELLEYARKNSLEQKYLFKHKYNNKLEHIWLTWNEYENIKRDIDLYNLNNYDNLNASEIPQMMNTIFPEEQIALPNLVTIEPIFKKPINTINDLQNEFKENNISFGI